MAERCCPLMLQFVGEIEGSSGMFAGVGHGLPGQFGGNVRLDHALEIGRTRLDTVRSRVLGGVKHGLPERDQRLPAKCSHDLELFFIRRPFQLVPDLRNTTVYSLPACRLFEHAGR